MFNVKWGAFPAGAAFFLAFFISLLFARAGLPMALLRGVIFAALFFGIGCGAWILINRYVPELFSFAPEKDENGGVFPGFSADAPSGGQPEQTGEPTIGANVNITLDAALPGNSYGIEGIGNIADLVSRETESDPKLASELELEPMLAAEGSGDIDQMPANSYTSESGGGAFASDDSQASRSSAAEAGGLGNFSSFLDGLASKNAMGDSDDSMSDLFQTLSSDGRSAGSNSEEAFQPERKAADNQSAEFKGDFSPKEIAMGIRTALAKEKKG